MTESKQRITITVDPQLAAAGQLAVASGQADSMSSWVSAAIEDKIARDHKLDQLRAAIADFEAEFGEITDAEITVQRRNDRQRATVVRGPKSA